MPIRVHFLSLLFLLAGAMTLSGQTDGTRRWAFNTGGFISTSIASSPAVGLDGTIYVGTQNNYLYAITPAGVLTWRYLLTDDVDSVPAVAADGTIYCGSWNGKLLALNPNGTKKWEYLTSSYIFSSPAVAADGTIYVGSGDFSLHAVNPDGTLRWKYLTGDWVDSSPAIAADGTVYFGSWDHTFYALTSAGELKWSYATGAEVLSSPALGADGTVYVGSSDHKLYAFSPSGTKLWEFLTGDGIESSPVVDADGSVYVASKDGKLYAVTSIGTQRWIYTSSASWISTPALRNDSLVIGTTANSVVCLNTSDGSTRWTLATGDWVDSSPLIVANGTIYFGCLDGKLYSVNGNGQPASASAAWPMFHRDPARQGRAAAQPPAAQTITFAGPADQPFSSTPLPLSALATSGLPVSFTLLGGPAQLVGDLLTFTGTGTVTVRASQAGNANYNTAPNVDRSFTVLPNFLSWQSQNFTAEELADPSRSGPDAIYGFDGLTNLLKYAFGLEPKIDGTTVLPVLTATATDWIYSYTRPNTTIDLTYAVEVSTDLAEWTTDGVTHEFVSNSTGFETWQGRYPFAASANIFFRLKVSRP